MRRFITPELQLVKMESAMGDDVTMPTHCERQWQQGRNDTVAATSLEIAVSLSETVCLTEGELDHASVQWSLIRSVYVLAAPLPQHSLL